MSAMKDLGRAASMGRGAARGIGVVLGVALPLALASPVAAHDLTGRYASPLPLAAYLAAAAIAVALSFTFVLLRSAPVVARPYGVPRTVRWWVRLVFRATGLLAWLWIVAQTVVGDPGDSDVASLFLWVYGWVGLAIISAFIAPVWRWIDPFATLHDLGAWAFARAGMRGWRPAPYHAALGHWPAAVGFVVFVWLELAFKNAAGGRNLGIVLVAYTAVTLAAMAQYGRDVWREQGETFSVWFDTLGRLARWARHDAEATILRRQPFGAGLVRPGWDVSLVSLVAIATASIIYDGLSQTKTFLDVFGVTGIGGSTLTLAAFLAVVVTAVLLVSTVAGLPALGAGLLPIAVGYLVAHYLTYLLGDGQRIVVALSDPFGRGWNLIGATGYEPNLSWIPSGLVWAAQLLAVVGGHVVGAWAGHQAALAEATSAALAAPSTAGRAARAGRGEAPRRAPGAARGPLAGRGPVAAPGAVAAGGVPGVASTPALAEPSASAVRRRQVPLAALMVALTVLTLWSLGQVVVQEPAQGAVPQAAEAPVTAPST